MSKRYLIEEDTLAGIAGALKEKTGTSDPIPVKNFKPSIEKIRTYADPIMEGLTITPTGTEIVKTPPANVDGFNIVTVAGDPNLIPENIMVGTTIYGVEGSHPEGLDTSDATAIESDILEGATAYVNGVKITGTHVCPAEPILAPLIVTPTGDEIVKTPDDGVDGFSEVTVEGDRYLIPENIKQDVTIYGVTGELVEKQLQEGHATPGAQDVMLTPEEGYDGFSKVTIDGDPNLVAANIRNGVSIFGVYGGYGGGGSGSGSGSGSGGAFGFGGAIMELNLIWGERRDLS